MVSGYFHKVAQESPTRLWINNPTGPEMEKAISAGAIGCTTNPAYCSKLLKGEPEYIKGIIAEAVSQIDDDDAAAEHAYNQAALRIMRHFMPIYQESEGASGYVTVQHDPRREDDPSNIIESARRASRLSENFMAKIPVTVAGMQAIEALVSEGIPICATEVFSIAQAIYACDAYRRSSHDSGKHPPFYVTHITGIFDQYLMEMARRQSIDIDAETLSQAGCMIAHKEYRLLKERGYDATMLGGGARGTQHFTEMVGGEVSVTINWSTAEELIKTNGPVVCRMDAETPQEVVDELIEKLPDFRKSFYEDGLAPEAFADFGPVVLFRNMFLAGYDLLLKEVAASRANSR